MTTFSKIKAGLGVVQFLKAAWADKHIADALAFIAKKTKQPEAAVKAPILAKIAEFESVAKYSTILYETVALNVIESELFNALEDIEHDAAPKFDPVLFMALIRAVKAEHPGFFPLRNFADSKPLLNARYVLVPGDKKYDSVGTAAATAGGVFIFNTKFMQQLLDYATIKGLKPKDKKYANNGGKFPPQYAYLEFLIMHELMHYSQADFHYGKIYKDVSPKLLNFVGDFRSNYELVKAGYEQLPIGLYSDHINYDRQKTYKEMIDVVKAEMDKLPKQEQDKVQKQLESQEDEHDAGEDEGDEPDPSNTTEERAEENASKVSEKMAKRGAGGGEKPADAAGKGASKGGMQSKGGKNTDSDYEKRAVKPRYSWRTLLEKAVKSAEETEETYSKQNRRSITGTVMAATHGVAAVKPGEVTSLSNIKLYLVVDSSGSMHSELAKVYANLKTLLASKEAVPEFMFSRFSDSVDLWKCNTKSDTAVNTQTDKQEKASKLFLSTYGGGTNLSDHVVASVKAHAQQDFNTIIFSDQDIISGGNLENLKAALKLPNVYVIFDSAETFQQAAKVLKSVSYNVSHL